MASLSTPASTSIFLDSDDIYIPPNPSRSSIGTSWIHPDKHEFEVYVGHFRCIALSAVQNMLFLLRNASASVIEIYVTQYIADPI